MKKGVIESCDATCTCGSVARTGTLASALYVIESAADGARLQDRGARFLALGVRHRDAAAAEHEALIWRRETFDQLSEREQLPRARCSARIYWR